MKILCVCLGNICRSPAAESVLKSLVLKQELEWRVDSAGTSAYHQGNLADERMLAVLSKKGYPVPSRSRQVLPDDLVEFDLILAMDHSNLQNLIEICPDKTLEKKIELFCKAGLGQDMAVPDPYYGGMKGFEEVLSLVERNSQALIKKLQTPKSNR